MATMTLLDMTQNIMSAMESDNVDSIGDTTESEAVALVIKETYFDLMAQQDWPFLKAKATLTALGDTDNPTKMRFPTTVNTVYWIKYNKKDVSYLSPKDFQDLLDGRTEEADVVNSSGYGLDHDPQYWTSFDDDFVFFDSIDLDEDTTLQASKSVIHALSIPSWTHTDTFVPTLPEKMFPLLLADAKGTCFLNIKQTGNAKEERKAQRLKVKMQPRSIKNKMGTPGSGDSINYGRR
jgi:hypothetical protein